MGTFESGFDLLDEFGEPAVTSGWRGRMEVRAGVGGDLVATFAESGGDGTLTCHDYGHVLLVLPSTFTETMTATNDSAGQINSAHVADVEVWNSSTPTVIQARHGPVPCLRPTGGHQGMSVTSRSTA